LAWVMKRAAKAFHAYQDESNKRRLAMAARLQQCRDGVATIWGQRLEFFEAQAMKSLVLSYRSFVAHTLLLRVAFRPLVECLAIVAIGVLLAWKLGKQIHGQVKMGENFTTLAVLAVFAFRPLKNMAGIVVLWAEIKGVIGRLDGLWHRLAPCPGLQGQKKTAAHSPARVAGVGVCIGGHWLLRHMDVPLKPGDRLAIVGPSGSGKTTLLRAMAGLLVPDEGQCSLWEHTRLVTQKPYLFAGTVLENILYTHRPTAPLIDRAHQLMLELRLAHAPGAVDLLASRPLGSFGLGLSGGERARVALARALLDAPQCLLLDEPTANLDQESAQAFWQAVQRWHRSDSTRVLVVVSHVMEEAAHCPTWLFLQGGRQEAYGPASQVQKVLAQWGLMRGSFLSI